MEKGKEQESYRYVLEINSMSQSRPHYNNCAIVTLNL